METVTAEKDVSSTTFVSFGIGKEVYAVDVFKVSEVIQPREVTEVPDMPTYVLGVINLRGHVIPVVDLKKRLGLGETKITLDTRMIVIEHNDNDDRMIAIITDYVTDVVSFEGKKLLNPPDMGTKIKNKFLKGIYDIENDGFMVVLDIEAIIEADADATFIKEIRKDDDDDEDTEVDEPENIILENDEDTKNTKAGDQQ